MFVFALFGQFLNDEFVSIFESIFCAPVKMFGKLCPFLEPFVVSDELEEFDVFV